MTITMCRHIRSIVDVIHHVSGQMLLTTYTYMYMYDDAVVMMLICCSLYNVALHKASKRDIIAIMSHKMESADDAHHSAIEWLASDAIAKAICSSSSGAA